jgi:hypothetical protein
VPVARTVCTQCLDNDMPGEVGRKPLGADEVTHTNFGVCIGAARRNASVALFCGCDLVPTCTMQWFC